MTLYHYLSRQQRRALVRSWLTKTLFGPDYKVIHRGDLTNLYAYVTLTNDLTAIAHRAGRLVDGYNEGTQTQRATQVVLLSEQVRAYRRAYPEHAR